MDRNSRNTRLIRLAAIGLGLLFMLAAAVARVLRDRAEQLEHEIRAVGRVDEQQLAARGARLLDRLARQGRREKHVVHADRAAATLALFF